MRRGGSGRSKRASSERNLSVDGLISRDGEPASRDWLPSWCGVRHRGGHFLGALHAEGGAEELAPGRHSGSSVDGAQGAAAPGAAAGEFACAVLILRYLEFDIQVNGTAHKINLA